MSLVLPGVAGTAPQDVTFKGAPATCDQFMAHNMALVCEKFKDILGIEAATDRVLPEMTANRMIMIEVTGGSGGKSDPEGSITVDFHILKIRTTTTTGGVISTESAIYTVNSLLNLLIANNDFDGLNGIAGIRDYNYLAGQPYIPPVRISQDHGDMFDGALVQVTYFYAAPISPL